MVTSLSRVLDLGVCQFYQRIKGLFGRLSNNQFKDLLLNFIIFF